MFLNSFYIITIIKKPTANTVLKTIFAFYSIDNSSLKLPWAALKYFRIGDSCAVTVSFVTFAWLEGDCVHVGFVSCKITILGGYEIKGAVSCITSISVCFLFTLNWWSRRTKLANQPPQLTRFHSNFQISGRSTPSIGLLKPKHCLQLKKSLKRRRSLIILFAFSQPHTSRKVGDITLRPLEDSSMALNIQPIVGADFLLQHKLLVDLEQRRLIDTR